MCTDCDIAGRIWHWGGYFAHCEGCKTRALAVSDARVRNTYYRQLHQATGSQAEVREAQQRIKAEYHRIQALRAAAIIDNRAHSAGGKP